MKKILSKLDARFGKRVVRVFFALLVVLLIAPFVFGGGAEEELPPDDSRTPVRVTTVEELAGTAVGFSTVGTVRATSEARLETEAGGRVTVVRVAIGDRVAAGTILAEIENASERAALLSAEGSYESALVASSQVTTGASAAYRGAYVAADDAVRKLADELFTNPLPEQGIIGFRLNTTGQSGSASAITAERRALEEVLRLWEQRLPLVEESTPEAGRLLTEGERDLLRVTDFIERIAAVLTVSEQNTVLTETERASYNTRFSSARTRLDSALASLTSARANYQNGAPASQSDALMKQALGSLQAARIAYEKTLVRTPISGEINAFYLRQNEYVTSGAPAAVVANNAALEVTTYINERERAGLTIGDSVMIGDAPGVITHIAPAIDPATRKIEVRVSAESADLANGSTVRITFSGAADPQDTRIFLPIVAVKLAGETAQVFSVENETLVAHEIEIGTIRGSAVEIVSGVTTDMIIVADVRGLAAGESVRVAE